MKHIMLFLLVVMLNGCQENKLFETEQVDDELCNGDEVDTQQIKHNFQELEYKISGGILKVEFYVGLMESYDYSGSYEIFNDTVFLNVIKTMKDREYGTEFVECNFLTYNIPLNNIVINPVVIYSGYKD